MDDTSLHRAIDRVHDNSESEAESDVEDFDTLFTNNEGRMAMVKEMLNILRIKFGSRLTWINFQKPLIYYYYKTSSIIQFASHRKMWYYFKIK